jgi:hypothetical protein
MRLTGALALTLTLTFALPSLGLAQSTDDEEDTSSATRGRSKKKKAAPAAAPAPAETAAPAEPADEPLQTYDEGGEELGTSENPDAPKTDWDKRTEVAVETTAAPITRETYPIERIYRPIVLPRGMLEAGFETPITLGDLNSVSGLLRASYSVDGKLQLGLRYGTGSLTEVDNYAGKAISIDVEYAIFPWLAAQIALPINFDPYAQGLTLGVPMQWTFVDRFRIEVGRDLVSFKLYRFLPSAALAWENEFQAAADAVNTATSDGELNLGGRFIYQFKPNLAGDARYNIRYVDFQQDGVPHELSVGATYSTSNRLDVAARVGFADLADATDNFIAQLAVAFRM